MPAGDAQCELLFGLLAIRLDLLDAGMVLAALRDWADEGKYPSLGARLQQGGALDEPTRELLDRLTARHLAAHGDDPARSLAAIGPVPGIQGWLATVEDAELRGALERLIDAPGPSAPADSGSDEGETEAGSSEQSTVFWDAPGAGPDLRFAWDEPEPEYGRYTLLRSIARGGLGEVFVAHDAGLNREVALKIIQARLANHPLCRARFLIEAEITGGLEHPGIVPVYAIGRCEDGRPFYSMRLIRGESFHDVIARFHAETNGLTRSRMLRALLRYFIDICNVVAYAHSRGIVHRDIKPANILIGRYGETLLVDWGLAKPIGGPEPVVEHPDPHGPEPMLQPVAGSGVTPTAVGSTVGTPRYMSPEQANGDLDRIGPASDVYNLGATLYCLIAGCDPLHDVSDVSDVLRRVSEGDIPPPRTLRPDASTTLETICRKAMALDSSQRYASARALADDVELWLAELPTSVPERPGRRLNRWERRHRVLLRILGAALVVLAVAALLVSLFLR